MSTITRRCTRYAAVGALLAVTHFFTAATVSASDDAPRGLWLAGAAQDPSASSTTIGRLTLRDGVIAFAANVTEWQLNVADIKRARISDANDRLLEIEDESGETYYVTIFGPQMLTESPKKALQVIRRAMESAASRRE